jgi:hypothetical protein
VSERGFFAIDRGAWDHPLFAREKFTEIQAWLWLISNATWEEKRVRIGSSVINLQRGQLAFATRFLAEKWMWSHSKVVRYISRLKTEAMIDTQPTRDATLITICNYDKYQYPRNAVETQTETQTETLPERSRNKEEQINKLDAAPAALDPEAELFRRGREVLGKQAGGMISKLLTAKSKNIALARAAIEQASTKSDPREYIGAIIRGQQPAAQQQPNWIDGIEGVL